MSQLNLFGLPPRPAWSVTDLTRHVRQVLEEDAQLQDVWVQGEVSNFSRPASGHLYFTLKDSGAALRCVMWRNAALRLPALPRDGEALEVHGAISVYEAGGQYQLYADLLRPAGEGALYQEFLRLKARLEAEGLFDPLRKRPLPAWPQHLAVITSPSGAALRDILNTLRRRFPLAQVTLLPTPVQGVEAPPGIIAALQNANQRLHPDVILLARGGGSIEDLWAFNDEGVARAIAASAAPVVSGVGHETDFTIADFVADLCAPTPTAAAELATPNLADIQEALGELNLRLKLAVTTAVNQIRWSFDSLQHRLQRGSPRARVDSDRQRLDEYNRRLGTGMGHLFQLERTRLNGMNMRLTALNPQAILERGYAILSTRDGQVIYRVSQAAARQQLQVRLSDGSLNVRVEDAP